MANDTSGSVRHIENIIRTPKPDIETLSKLNGLTSITKTDSKKMGKIRFGFTSSTLRVTSQICQYRNEEHGHRDDQDKKVDVPTDMTLVAQPIEIVPSGNMPKVETNSLLGIKPNSEHFVTKTVPAIKFSPNSNFYKEFCSLYTSTHRPEKLSPLPPLKSENHRSKVEKSSKSKKRPRSLVDDRRRKVDRHKIRKISSKAKDKRKNSLKKRVETRTVKKPKKVVVTQKREHVSPVRPHNRELLSPVSPNETITKKTSPTEETASTLLEDQNYPLNLADIPLPTSNIDQNLPDEPSPDINYDEKQLTTDNSLDIQSSNNILDLSAEIKADNFSKINENSSNYVQRSENLPPSSQLMNEYDLFESEIFKTNRNSVPTTFDDNENSNEKLSNVITDSQCITISPNSTPLVDELSAQEKEEPVRLVGLLRRMTTNPKMLSIIERLNALLDEKRLVMVDKVSKAPSTSSAAECTSVEVIGHDVDHDSPDIVPNLNELRDPRLRRHFVLDCNKDQVNPNQQQPPLNEQRNNAVEEKLFDPAHMVDKKSSQKLTKHHSTKSEPGKNRKRRRSRRSPPPPPPPPRRDRLKTQRAAVNTPPVQNSSCVDPRLMVQSTSNVQAFNANMFAFDQQSGGYYQYPYQQPQQQFFFVPVATYRAVYQNSLYQQRQQHRANLQFYAAGTSDFTPTPKSSVTIMENTNADRNAKLSAAGGCSNSQTRKDDGRFAVPAPKRFSGPIKKRYL
uniref:Uncharacterized protein n=1 Tax=Romanomermis culicivorax TaxID=13658 RepID=A0A915JNW4_ROMCU